MSEIASKLFVSVSTPVQRSNPVLGHRIMSADMLLLFLPRETSERKSLTRPATTRWSQLLRRVVFGGPTNRGIVMEYDVKQRVMNVNVAVVVD